MRGLAPHLSMEPKAPSKKDLKTLTLRAKKCIFTEVVPIEVSLSSRRTAVSLVVLSSYRVTLVVSQKLYLQSHRIGGY